MDNDHSQSNEARELLAKGDDLFRQRDYTGARRNYEKAFNTAKLSGNNSDMTEACAMIARTYLIEENMEPARQWFNVSEQLALESEPFGWSRYLGVKGRFLWHDNKLNEATELFERLYEYCHRNENYERAIDAAHMVAITGDYKKQVEWGKRGIKEAESSGITGWLGPLWNNLGATYEEMGQYDSSLNAYLQAREYHYERGTETNKMIADWAVGHAYLNLKDYDTAEKWLLPLIDRFGKQNDIEFVGLTSRDLGDIDYARGRSEEALSYYLKAVELLKKAGMDEWDPSGFQEIQIRIEELRKSQN